MGKQRKERYLYIDGHPVPVSEEIYQVYWQHADKEDYFMRQLKSARCCRDEHTQTVILMPARESSLDELLSYGQPVAVVPSYVEDLVLSGIWLEELLQTLSEEEQKIVRLFYIEGRTERAASAAMGLPKTTFRRREQRLRKKLGVLLKKFL